MPPMARTNRDAPAPSVDALDDLNLDDMFEGGDDGLFDGLDMDMNDIGDITGETALSPPKKKSSKAGGTINYSGADLDAVDLDLFGDIGVDDGATNTHVERSTTTTSKSRKVTKRKIKTPSLDDDDDDDEYDTQPNKKKRKATKITATAARPKGKKTKGVTPPATIIDVPPVVDTTKVDSTKVDAAKLLKKKAKSGALTFQRSASDGNAVVAAAGRFGSQQKRGIFPQLPRASSKSKLPLGNPGKEGQGNVKLVKGKKTSIVPTLNEGIVTPISTPKPPNRRVINQIELSAGQNPSLLDTFCGLRPSSTLFYPFMPQMPAENSMKKCHKQYPIIDKIHSSFASHSATPNGIPDTSREDDAIFKLLTKEMESNSIPTVALGASIAACRKSIIGTERQKLIGDFKCISILLKRQHDFLYTSLHNMERWIKASFSASDYAQVYGPESSNTMVPSPINKKWKSSGILSSFLTPVIRVRIKCEGFREPKMTTPLFAQLYTPPKPPVIVKSDPVRPTKKRKPIVEVEKQVPPQVDILKLPKYALMTPSQRRVQIQEALTRRAHQLEAKHIETEENRHKSLERRQTILKKVVEDDDLLVINTMTLWKWTDKALYFSDITADDVQYVMQHAKQPERDEKDLLWEENSIRKSNKGHTKSLVASYATKDEEGDASISPGSLFDRMTSLLVEEGSGDEDESDDSSLEGWEDEENKIDSETVIDLSNFSLEERAFMHLRSAGLIDESCPPRTNPAIIEDDTLEEPNDFDSVIAAIKADLLKIQKVNNSRAVLLETTAMAQIEVSNEMKSRDEHNNNVIAKYNQLLKRQKENKKNVRQRGPKRADEEWMPW